jgi:1,2-diacylglycerol 3-beta-galactosyltransferase
MKPKIVFLYGSAGGGHKSVADALVAATIEQFGNRVETESIDVIKDYAPIPFNKGSEAYSLMIKSPQFWKQYYKLGDGPMRAKLISSSASLYVRRAARELLDNHPADLYVSVFHFAVPVLDYIKRQGVKSPYVTVVTDLVSVPPIWFDERSDLVIVPTEQARERALEADIDPKLIKVMGLPIASKFTKPHPPKSALRQKLGWPTDRPMILLMAGGEGVGPLAAIGQALANSGLNLGMALVTGKNKRLKSKLEAMDWAVPTHVYGFSDAIDEFMYAADIIVTKAGPTSIIEACVCRLPMVLYGALPGQEEGNIEFVTDEGAGVWAPTPDEVVTAVGRWIKHPALLRAAASTSRKLAMPNASRQISRLLVQIAADQARAKSSR